MANLGPTNAKSLRDILTKLRNSVPHTSPADVHAAREMRDQYNAAFQEAIDSGEKLAVAMEKQTDK